MTGSSAEFGTVPEVDAPPPPGATGTLWRDTSFRPFLGARAVSILGDRVGELVLPFFVLEYTGSAFIAGLVGAANHVPALILAPWVGVGVDRWSKVRIMVLADLVRAVALALLVVSILWGRLSPELLMFSVFLLGIGDVWFLTAARAFLPSLVGRKRLVAANGMLEAADAATTLTGPALGGLLLQTLAMASALAANAASFVVSAVLLSLVRLPPRSAAPTTAGAWRSGLDLVAGFRALWVVPQQRLLQVVLLGLNFQSGAIVLLIVALARDVLGLSGLSVGMVLTGAGMGGLMTSALVAPRLTRAPWGPTFGLLLLAMAGATVALSMAGGALDAFLANAVLDGAAALAFVVSGTVRQALTPDALLGRVTAASYVLNALARMSGVFAAEILITQLGHREALWAFAATLALIGVPAAVVRSARVPLSDLHALDS